MKYRFSVVVSTVIHTVFQIGWLGYCILLWAAAEVAASSAIDRYQFYLSYIKAVILWRGVAVALGLILTYLALRFAFRQFLGEDNVL